MAFEITVPRLGWNMDEGIFAGWHKQHGDAVRRGEPLFSLEGDKATQDVESLDEGRLQLAAGAPEVGARVLVGQVIGHLVAIGEVASRLPMEKSTPPRDRQKISPLARRVAKEFGIETSTLTGTGRTGRIRKADILAIARSRPENKEEIPDGATIPIDVVRRRIAERMVASQHQNASVTYHAKADATNLVALRAQFRALDPSGNSVPSFTDLFVKLTATALQEHSWLNARWEEESIRVSKEIHIGIAVETDAGLLVPVVRNVETLALRTLIPKTRDLIARARSGRLQANDMTGGTFTITNLGMFGIEWFTPIINPPECAILGLGRITREPVFIGDRVEGRDRIGLSLTADHRIVDGARAARFLQSLIRLLENPIPALLG